jgi:glucose/arabinose dehydrogenase
MKPLRCCLAALTLVCASFAAQAQSAAIDGSGLAIQVVASGLDQPVFLTTPLNDPRLFVVEQTGRIKLIDGGRVLSAAFLDITDKISGRSEQGLLGLTFHPDFASNRRFFVTYTDRKGDLVLSEWRALDAARTDPASEQVLLTVPHPGAANHNGGWIGFGPQGLLYIGTGDGGGAGDRDNNAQNPDQLLGKMLRIDVDRGAPYAIPASNPYAQGGGRPEIFALGLRNPWRAAFDGTDLYIGDVGQNHYEEINVLSVGQPGANLGWRLMEGQSCFTPTNCAPAGLTLPLHVYDHRLGCSVTGGYVYRGAAMPDLAGRYFFSDFCTGTLMSFRLTSGKAQGFVDLSNELGSLGQITSFGEDSSGEIYALTIDGQVLKLVPLKAEAMAR